MMHLAPIRQARTLILAAAVPLSLAALALDAHRLRGQLRQARLDPLTQLPTRAVLESTGPRMAAAHGDTLAVLIDADHVDRTTAGHAGVSGDVGRRCPVRDIQPSGGEVVCLRISRSTAICGRSNFRSGAASYRLTT
jgi:hypothetical protein